MSNKLALKGNIGLRKKTNMASSLWQLHLVSHILAKSYTAGHFRAIDDQVNMAPKDRS